MMRRAPLGLLLLWSGCSFIDDFDRFHKADRAGDGGARDDGGLDAMVGADAGIDSGRDDGGAVDDDAGSDGSMGDDLCFGKADGTSCGELPELICLKGFCRVSRCGDGYVDNDRGEQCDELNIVRGDGCEPGSCQYSCTMASQCDNGVVCDGEELCDLQSHRCIPDPVGALGKQCPTPAGNGAAGLCDANGYCVGERCGDGTRDPGEECDPNDPAATPGCRPDCTQGCTSDEACNDANPCNGSETCLVQRGECRPGVALSCIDNDACTLDGVCEPDRVCVHPLIDADGDGFSAATCAAGSALRGGDCDDTDSTVYPGATELCDGKDNDCDDLIDEPPVVMATCYPDADRDGYPTMQGSFMACSCPAGSRTRRSDNQWDCYDSPAGGADAHPGQTAYFGVGYPCTSGAAGCVSFDYDCSGMNEPRYPSGTGTCGLLGTSLLCGGGGYNGQAPACGATAAYVACSGTVVCTSTPEQRRQLCR